MKRKFWIIFMVALVISGVAFAQAKSEVKTLTFWDENAGETRTPYYEELIDRYNKSQDKVVVVYEGIPSTSAKEKYDVAIATKTTPDIGHCNAAWGSDWLAQECLLPLDDYFSAWPEAKDINTNYVALNRDLDEHGRLFMITDTVSTPLMWVRTDYLKKSGLEVPRTWDDFFNAVKVLTDKTKGVYGFSLRGGAGSCVELQHALYAYSGIENYFDENGKCTINSPEHVKFLKELTGFYKKYTAESDITNGYKEMVAAFDGGSAAIIFHNTGSKAEHEMALNPDQYQAVSFPISKRGTHSYTAGSQGGYCIFDTCKDSDAAWDFISFMLSAESNSYFNENIGQIPMNNKVLDKSWVKNSQSTNEALRTLASPNCLLVAQPKYLPEYSLIMNTITPPIFQAVLAGEVTVEKFLTIWADAFTEAYAAYGN